MDKALTSIAVLLLKLPLCFLDHYLALNPLQDYSSPTADFGDQLMDSVDILCLRVQAKQLDKELSLCTITETETCISSILVWTQVYS